MIEIKNLTYGFDKRFKVLLDVNLKIESNTILKSNNFLDTQILFRVLTKQDRDYQGEVFFDDVNLKKISLKNLEVAYITKEPNLLKRKSILFNIAYPLIVRKTKKIEALNLAKSALKKFNLIEIENKKINQLSYFEKLIVTILRTSLRQCKYIFVDDIFTPLNESEKEIILNLLNKISFNFNENKNQNLQKSNPTLIVSTNDEFATKNLNISKIYSFSNGTLKTN